MATSETEIGMPAFASYTITFIRQATATVVEFAGHPKVGAAASAGGTIVLGSVDVIDAANNGSFEDVSLGVTSRVIVDALPEQLWPLALPVLECPDGRSALQG